MDPRHLHAAWTVAVLYIWYCVMVIFAPLLRARFVRPRDAVAYPIVDRLDVPLRKPFTDPIVLGPTFSSVLLSVLAPTSAAFGVWRLAFWACAAYVYVIVASTAGSFVSGLCLAATVHVFLFHLLSQKHVRR